MLSLRLSLTGPIRLFARNELVLRLVDLPLSIEAEMLDERLTATLDPRSAVVIDRQIDEITFRLQGGPIEQRLGRDSFRPNGLQDRLEDRQRDPRPGGIGAERAALAVAIIVADPHGNGYVVDKTNEPAVDRIFGGSGLASDIRRERTVRCRVPLHPATSS